MTQMSFKDEKDKKEELEDAAEEAREQEKPAEEVEKNEDRKVPKGKDIESDEEGTDRTEKEIQESFEETEWKNNRSSTRYAMSLICKLQFTEQERCTLYCKSADVSIDGKQFEESSDACGISNPPDAFHPGYFSVPILF